MKRTLSSYIENRNNNFNLIRLIAGILVLMSHCYPLYFGSGASEPLKKLVGISLGWVAVDLFFISSGFLIAGSLFNRKTLSDFVKSRVLRIYPGLAISLLLTVFLLGPYFTKLPLLSYFTSPETYKFLLLNVTLFFGEEANLPGVFTALPLAHTVNGSLWTLPFEVRAYTLLVITGLLLTFLEKKWSIFGSKWFYLLIAAFGMSLHLFNYFNKILPISYFGAEYARLITMFFVGVAYYKYKDLIVLSNSAFYWLVILLIISSVNYDWFFVVYSLSLSYLLFYLAYVPKGFIRKFNTYGDYSYGIYIYAFPIQQAILALSTNISLFTFFLTSLVITFVFAFFSWQFVEKPALQLKNKTIMVKAGVKSILTKEIIN